MRSQVFQRAKRVDRKEHLFKKPRRNQKELRFATNDNNQWNDIRNILGNSWTILTSDPKLCTPVPKTPLLTARRAPNLSDLITSSHFSKPCVSLGRGTRFKGSFPCGDCSICPHMEPTDKFTSPANGVSFTLRDYINCKTKQVIYGLLCCSSQIVYTGQTSQQLIIGPLFFFVCCPLWSVTAYVNLVCHHFFSQHNNSYHYCIYFCTCKFFFTWGNIFYFVIGN